MNACMCVCMNEFMYVRLFAYMYAVDGIGVVTMNRISIYHIQEVIIYICYSLMTD